MIKSLNNIIDEFINQAASFFNEALELSKKKKIVRKEILNPSQEKIIITTIETDDHYEESVILYNSFLSWLDIVQSFIERHSSKDAKDFRELGELFSTYIIFQRTGPDIPEETWWSIYIRETKSIISRLIHIMITNKDSFMIFKARNIVKYNDVSIKIIYDEDRYKIEIDCDQGEAEYSFENPFEEKDIEIFLLRHCQPRHSKTRGWVPTTVKPFSDFGFKLFNTIIAGDVRDLFFRAIQQSEANNSGIRIRIRTKKAPKLANLPWEFMYDGRDFFCLSVNSPIIRYIDLNVPVRPLLVKPPLRILVTISSPVGLPQLNVEKEEKQLRIALGPLIALGIVQLDVTPEGSLRNLQRMLRSAENNNSPYHVWHYIGHGTYDSTEKTSVLALEQEKQLLYVSGFELGTLFNSYPSLRLVLLNACEGARTSSEDPLAGVATALIERGIPAVIAMQFEVTDDAAIVFADEFYRALVDGLPIDIALTEARRSIFFLPNHSEWASPVLFMRSSNGIIFDMESIL